MSVTLIYPGRIDRLQDKIVSLNLADLEMNKFPSCINAQLFPRLLRLDLSNNNLKEIDLRLIAEFEDLNYLSLKNNDLEEIDLSPLFDLRSLVRLNISQNKFALTSEFRKQFFKLMRQGVRINCWRALK